MRHDEGVSMVIPAYNEAGNIRQAVESALPLLQSLHPQHELIVVESGSTDRTGEILDALVAAHPALRVIHEGAKLGLGSALMAGFEATRYEQLLYIDGDNPYDIADFRRALPLLQEFDIVNGFRLSRNDAWVRRMYTMVFRFALRALFNVRLRDANIGFKVMRRSVVQSLGLTSKGFLIDTELLIKAHRRGHRIREFGVVYHARQAGTSTVTPRAALRVGLELLQLRWRLWTDAPRPAPAAPAEAAPLAIIFNADDFGLSPEINRGIIDCCRRGVVRSVSLMVNMPSAEEAVTLIRPLLPQVSIGLHLNLVKGRPLTDPARILSLVDARGEFLTLPRFVRRLYTGRVRKDELAMEIRAQMEWGSAHGLAFSHVDSHRHVHVLPGVFPMVQEVAQSCGLQVIRVPLSRRTIHRRWEPKQFVLQSFARQATRQLAPSCAPVAEAYAELRLLLDGRTIDDLLRVLRSVHVPSIEIGCHPGYPDGSLTGSESRIHDRDEERRWLTDPALRQHLASAGFSIEPQPR